MFKVFVRVPFFLSSLWLGWCCVAIAGDTNKTVSLLLIHTHNNNGHFWENKDGESGMPAKKTLFDILRSNAQKTQQAVLTFSTGDVNTGTPESDLQSAQPDFIGMNLLKYDAMSLGNHEFDNAPNILKQQRLWANFPFLSANIVLKRYPHQTLVKPYHIVHRKGLKIAVIGLTGRQFTDNVAKHNIRHLTVLDPVTHSQEIYRNIESKEHPDLIITLFHAGHLTHRLMESKKIEQHLIIDQLQLKTPHIFLMGHDEDTACIEPAYDKTKFCRPYLHRNTWIVQGNKGFGYVSATKFHLKDGTLTAEIQENIPVNLHKDGGTDRFTPNPLVYKILDKYVRKIDHLKQTEVAYLSHALTNHCGRWGQKPVSLLVLFAQIKLLNVDFALFNNRGIRAGLPQGKITFLDLQKITPFKNKIVLIKANGRTIMRYMNRIFQHQKPQYYNISMEIHSYGRAKVLDQFRVNNKPLLPEKIYTFTLPDFLINGGARFPNIINDVNFEHEVLSITYEELMLDFFKQLPSKHFNTQPFIEYASLVNHVATCI
ncbi:MAG: 5'-nucleotidase C-terminal domain-containing protein [Shewanellaceae bacterium]|nr:5'-nucleotidase C-terminal domain-containing protein [Shewanellaceae bacterium]